MAEAIRLSMEKMQQGQGGPFGAVIVKNNQIIARGWNQVTSCNDPTAHAEIVAIRSACKHLNTFQLDGCEMYVNCEPCPMCLAAIYWSRLDRVYFGATRKDAAAIGFDDEHIYDEIGLPFAKKQLSMTQIMRPEALAAFAAWEELEDKVMY